MIKRTLCLALIFLCALPLPSYALNLHDTGYDTPDNRYPIVESDTPVTIHVDGAYLPTDVDPVLISGRTMVPLRAAGEALGADIKWNGNDQSITVKKDNNTILFYLYSTTYYLNGKASYSDATPILQKNRTLLPLRVFAESLNAKVNWDQYLYDVQIDTAKADQSLPALPAQVPADVEKLIKKYYVAPNQNDSFVGSWAKPDYHYDAKYIFVSKTGNNAYQVTSIRWNWSYGTPRPFITLRKEPASINSSNILVRANMVEPLYYFGMSPQYPFTLYSPYDYYSVAGSTLTHIGTDCFTSLDPNSPTEYIPDSTAYAKF
ncbi:MAG: copper amine oxidase N-terminal domain-containing protein [Peptococcaceae bacterium]|nr:copper amine oxidase N-terminal domain-containing protein [Peptococcaceae bacterium]